MEIKGGNRVDSDLQLGASVGVDPPGELLLCGRYFPCWGAIIKRTCSVVGR